MEARIFKSPSRFLSGLDPHIWTAPSLVKRQVRTILSALQDIDFAHSAAYKANYERFAAEIDQLDAQFKEMFKDAQGLRFMVFHPSWGYFAHAYGLRQVPIEIQGKDPKPAQLKALIEYARAKKIKIIFVQPQFSTKRAALLAQEIGGQVVFADPLAEDWMANLREVGDKFKSALK
jgi:zinc transport system substrate-binding protein